MRMESVSVWMYITINEIALNRDNTQESQNILSDLLTDKSINNNNNMADGSSSNNDRKNELDDFPLLSFALFEIIELVTENKIVFS